MSKIPHIEAIAERWVPFLDSVQDEIVAVLQTVIEKGGTRDVWQQLKENEETLLLAYPEKGFVRSSVLLQGVPEGKLDTVSVIPLLEGLQNELIVEDIFPWKNKVEGEVLVHNQTIGKSFWIYNPLFYRDREDMQLEQLQGFLIAGLVHEVRPAYLDELTIAKGPAYEEHAAKYMSEHPEASRLDVPPLKVSLKGQQSIGLGRCACEYQARIQIQNLYEFEYEVKENEFIKMYSFILNLATPEEPMLVVLYASEKACTNNIKLEDGMDVDIYFWLQGRVVD